MNAPTAPQNKEQTAMKEQGSMTDFDFLKAQTERLEALGTMLQYRGKRKDGGIMIKGQAFTVRTIHDLVLMVVRLRYEKGLNDKARERILKAAQTYGLLDTEGNRTPKYFALMDDEVEKLARELLAGLLRLTRILRIDENLRLIVDHVRNKAEAILVEGTTSATGGFW